MLPAGDALWDAPYLVVAETDGARPESRVFLAAAIAVEAIDMHFAAAIEREEHVRWDDDAGLVVARRIERLGAIILREAPLREPERGAVVAAFTAGIAVRGVAALPWSDSARQLRARVAFLRTLDTSWPDLSDEALTSDIATWLGPGLEGLRRWDDLRQVDLAAAVAGLLDWRRRAALESDAPTHVQVPSGSRIAVDYSDPTAPVLPVRLQEMFGQAETPRIAGGRVPLTIQLLSPAGRPVQVTRDLAGFWRSTYFDVRKDLRGRYPRHYWPDDPLVAEPTRRVRPRR